MGLILKNSFRKAEHSSCLQDAGYSAFPVCKKKNHPGLGWQIGTAALEGFYNLLPELEENCHLKKTNKSYMV